MSNVAINVGMLVEIRIKNCIRVFRETDFNSSPEKRFIEKVYRGTKN